MITEAGKATGSTVRKKTLTPKEPSLRQKSKKTADKKKVSAAVTKGKAVAVKKKKAGKRKGFVAPKTPTIYDIHPMRKYIELLLYECYLNRSPDFESELGINDLDSIKVNKTQLKKRIKTKKELIEVKKYMSYKIMTENHPDQKILMWEYLRNATLPTSIDLRYHFVPQEVKNMLKTFQQRRIIEGYSMMGYTPVEIAQVINRNKELIDITPIEVEVYQYFFWNLDSSGIMAVYPVQVLANYILQVKAQTLLNYRDIIAAQEKAGTLTEEVRADLTEVPMVNTPYYGSAETELYTPWKKIMFSGPGNALDTFRSIVAVSNGDISPARLNAMIRVSDYSVLTFDQQMQELSQDFVNAAEVAMEKNVYSAMAIVKGGLLPLAQTMLIFNIPKKDIGSNLATTQKIVMGQAKTLKPKAPGLPLEIDPYEDRERRRQQLFDENATDADFIDIPTESEVGQS